MSKLLSLRISLSRAILKRTFCLSVFLVIICSVHLPSFTDPQDPSPKKDISSFKSFVDNIISPQKIDQYLKHLTSIPHLAASPRNNDLAEYVLEEWKKFGLEDVHLVPYDVLLSFPKQISVELISPHHHKLSLKENSYPEDPDTQRTDVGIPYNAYSRSGAVTAPVVYANSGNPQDYDYLGKKGINLQGKIALVRYSAPYSYRGFKAYTAEKRGLEALLIFSDPKDDGYARGPVFPDGPWGPMSHIQRGGIPYDFIYPGDPLTPGWASTPGCRRIPVEDAVSLPKIMSVPISAQDALPLLKAMDGDEVPEEWRGALSVSYRIGGSQPVVRMKVTMNDPIKRIFNVVGCIKGTEKTDEIIVVGNHRDAWVFGGYDPSSGTACLIELARALAQAKKAGFVPRRTIYFGSWDAEEFTLTGSTEWGEDHREWLKKNLVAYLNVDSSASGKNFSVQAVPSLFPLIVQALRQVKDPSSGQSVYDSWKSGPSEKGTIAIASGSGQINPIGSGTDHAVFLNHIGAPALDMTFSGDYGVYHSMYDNYYWMSHFGDPGMHYTATLARIWAHMVIDLSCRHLIPLDYETYTRELRKYLEDWAELYDSRRKKSKGLFLLLSDMEKRALVLTPYLMGKKTGIEHIPEENIQKANQVLIQIERDFTDPKGIPNRNWFKHLVFGARYTYAVLLFPSLTEAAEAGDEDGVEQSLRNLEESIKKVILKLDEISKLINTK